MKITIQLNSRGCTCRLFIQLFSTLIGIYAIFNLFLTSFIKQSLRQASYFMKFALKKMLLPFGLEHGNREKMYIFTEFVARWELFLSLYGFRGDYELCNVM